MESKD
jgi:pentatricopeptide repeat protein